MSFFSSRPSPNKPSEAHYSAYTDPSGEFTTGELTASLWYVRHKPLLYKISKFVLIILSIGLWGFSVWQGIGYVIYQLQGNHALEQSLTTFPDYAQISGQLAPQSLKITGAQAFQSGENKYDLVADITNPDNRFVVEFDYYFSVGENITPHEHAFLLPSEERPVASLGLMSTTGSFDPPIIHLENIHWQRLDQIKYPNPRQFQNERLQFSISNLMFNRAEETAGLGAHQLTFTLTNNSAYSYRSADFYVGLYLQDSLVGVIPLHILDFRSQETRAVDVRSFAPNLSITDARVFPRINVYDPEVYLKP